MIRQCAAQPTSHIVKRGGRTALRDHDGGTDDLAPLCVRTAHHDGLGDGVELDECCLDQTRNHLKAAGVDQVVDAAVDDQDGPVEVADVVGACLLYTSDAADDLTRVDLGGR